MTGHLAFPLDHFEQAIHNDPDILGVVYTGSLGRGTTDRFSDLDIEIWLTDAAFAAGVTRWMQVLSYLGEIQFAYHSDSFVRGFVDPEWRRVDLEVRRRNDLQPHPRYARASIVKDTDAVLTRLIAQSPLEQISVSYDQAVLNILEAIDSQIYLALHNARGAVWSATGEISYRCSDLYAFLALLRGRRSYGFRFVETLLSPSEEALLRTAWPRMPSREENRRAARALWVWTRHVWAEAERILDQKLQITLNEEQFLNAIDTIYTWT